MGRAEGHTGCTDSARGSWTPRGQRPRARFDLSLRENREILRLAAEDGVGGPRRESHGNKTAMNGRGKSDWPVVPEKPANKVDAAATTAESVEGRGWAKGNSVERNSDRTRSRERLSQALDRVRQAAPIISEGDCASTPEAGAGCGSAASPDLCGGRRATGVPTATACQPRSARLGGRDARPQAETPALLPQSSNPQFPAESSCRFPGASVRTVFQCETLLATGWARGAWVRGGRCSGASSGAQSRSR